MSNEKPSNVLDRTELHREVVVDCPPRAATDWAISPLLRGAERRKGA